MPASLLHNKKCEANNNSKVRNGIMKALEENTREFNIYKYIYEFNIQIIYMYMKHFLKESTL